MTDMGIVGLCSRYQEKRIGKWYNHGTESSRSGEGEHDDDDGIPIDLDSAQQSCEKTKATVDRIGFKGLSPQTCKIGQPNAEAVSWLSCRTQFTAMNNTQKSETDPERSAPVHVACAV